VHDLRSSFSARYLGAGGSIFSLQKLLGHQDVRTTTKHYARLSAKSLLEASNLGSIAIPQIQSNAVSDAANAGSVAISGVDVKAA
jgi:hypothetical protein